MIPLSKRSAYLRCFILVAAGMLSFATHSDALAKAWGPVVMAYLGMAVEGLINWRAFLDDSNARSKMQPGDDSPPPAAPTPNNTTETPNTAPVAAPNTDADTPAHAARAANPAYPFAGVLDRPNALRRILSALRAYLRQLRPTPRKAGA